MPRWVLLSAVVAALASFTGGALVGAHDRAGASAPGLVKSTASAHVVQRQPAAGSCHARGSGRYSLPDFGCTPGAVDPAVTQDNVARTICRSGYSESVRPPESITEREKRASLVAYGDHRPLHAYEYDHLVPLELGGAPNDARNLWPEPGASPNLKDALENRLHRQVCDHQMTLAAAQLAIARNWIAAYRRNVGPATG
ncbi:MAG TPA: hypothetical protein VE571_03165 [Solirubrobacteraceae bacterium]|nr:hypothetical protein [Solirubrobacteraceae bacterium]